MRFSFRSIFLYCFPKQRTQFTHEASLRPHIFILLLIKSWNVTGTSFFFHKQISKKVSKLLIYARHRTCFILHVILSNRFFFLSLIYHCNFIFQGSVGVAGRGGELGDPGRAVSQIKKLFLIVREVVKQDGKQNGRRNEFGCRILSKRSLKGSL